MAEIIKFPSHTYAAKEFRVFIGVETFIISGTLDGFIDFYVPNHGTYPLSLGEARLLIAALNKSITDVEQNCLYGRDQLLVEDD